MDNRWITIHSGNLLKCSSKKSRARKKWRQRWYVLCSSGASAELRHFDNAKQAVKAVGTASDVSKESVDLVMALFSHPKHDNVLCIRLKDERELYLAALSSEDMDAWHSALAETFSQRKVCLKVQWQYQNDLGDWCSYSEAASAKLEDMRQRSITTFQLEKQHSGANKTYLIYLDDMVQASARSGTKRLIQRQTTLLPAKKQSATSTSMNSTSVSNRHGSSLPSVSSRSIAIKKPRSPLPQAHGSPKVSSSGGGGDGDGGSGRGDGRPSIVPNGSDSEDDVSEDVSVEDGDGDMYTWVFATDMGEWAKYDIDNCMLLEREYLSQAPICLLTSGKAPRFKIMTTRKRSKNNRAFVTFGAMQEINPVTGSRREVRRVLPGQVAQLNPPADVTNVSDVIGVATMRNANTPTPDWVSDESDSVKAMIESIRSRQLPRDSIQQHDVIGKGAFGRVCQGTLTTVDFPEGLKVAIKTLQGDPRKKAGEEQERKLNNEILKEASTMIRFEHPNIVRLVGVCCLKMPIMLVMEYMSCGDLQCYLRKPCTHLDIEQQLSIILQVTQAMVYLVSEKQFVHRDLAARNVLVHKEGDGLLTAKVTDFGLSRDLYSSEGYRMSIATEKLSEVRLPVKWMALESLEYFIFNSATDVWSFGVMTWEVMSHGQVPYPGIEAPLMYLELKRGLKLARPTMCPEEVYDVILKCCHHVPKERPNFLKLRDELTNLLCDVKQSLSRRTRSPKPQEDDWGNDDYRPLDSIKTASAPPKPPRAKRSPPLPARPPKPAPFALPSTAAATELLTAGSPAGDLLQSGLPPPSPKSPPPPVPQKGESKQCLLKWVQDSLHAGDGDEEQPPVRPHPPSSGSSDEDGPAHATTSEDVPERSASSPAPGSPVVSRSAPQSDVARSGLKSAQSSTLHRASSPPCSDRSPDRLEQPPQRRATANSSPNRPQATTSSKAESTAGLGETGDGQSPQAQRNVDSSVQCSTMTGTQRRPKTSSQIQARMKMFEQSGQKPPVASGKPALKAKPLFTVKKKESTGNSLPSMTEASPKPPALNRKEEALPAQKNDEPAPAAEKDVAPLPKAASPPASTPATGSDAAKTSLQSARFSPEEKSSTLHSPNAYREKGRSGTMPGGEHVKLAGRRAVLAVSDQKADAAVEDTSQKAESGDAPGDDQPVDSAASSAGAGDAVGRRPSSSSDDEYMVMKHAGRSRSLPQAAAAVQASSDPDQHSYVNVPCSPSPDQRRSVGLPDDSDDGGYEIMRKKSSDSPAQGSGDAEYSTAAEILSARGTPSEMLSARGTPSEILSARGTPEVRATPPPQLHATVLRQGPARPPLPLLRSQDSIDEAGYEFMSKPSVCNTPADDEGYTLASDLVSVRSTPETVSLGSAPRELSVDKPSSEQQASNLAGAATLSTVRKSFSLLTGLSRIRDPKEFNLLPLDTMRTLATEEGVAFSQSESEDELRLRLTEMWLERNGLAERTDELSDSSPLPDATPRPAAPLPNEALSPLDLIIRERKQSTDGTLGLAGAEDTPSPLRVSSPTATTQKLPPAAEGSGGAPADGATPATKKPPPVKPAPPPRQRNPKPDVPPRPSPTMLRNASKAATSPSAVHKMERSPSSPAVLRWTASSSSLAMPETVDARRLTCTDGEGYIDADSIGSGPARKLTGSSLDSGGGDGLSQPSTFPHRSVFSVSSYLTVNDGEDAWARSPCDDVIVALENELLAGSTASELQGMARCMAEPPPAAAQSMDRGQLTALVRFGVRSHENYTGKVCIAGAVMSANRCLLPPLLGPDCRQRIEPVSPSDDDLALMYEEGYTLASDLVYRGPARKPTGSAATASTGARHKKASTPDSVFSGQTDVTSEREPTQHRADLASAAIPMKKKARPMFGRKSSTPTLADKPPLASPPSPSHPAPPKTPEKAKKNRLASAYTNVILPAFSPAKGKFATLFKRKQNDDARSEKPPMGRSHRSKSITEVSMVSTKKKTDAAGGGGRGMPGRPSIVSLNKRGSVDDTFIDSMRSNAAGFGRVPGSPGNYYLEPSDEQGMQVNEYAAVEYAMPTSSNLPPPLEVTCDNGDDNIDGDDYMDMASYQPNSGLDADDEYQDMAALPSHMPRPSLGDARPSATTTTTAISMRQSLSHSALASELSAGRQGTAAQRLGAPLSPPPSVPPPSLARSAPPSHVSLLAAGDDNLVLPRPLEVASEGDFDIAYSVMPVSHVPLGLGAGGGTSSSLYRVSDALPPQPEQGISSGFLLKNVARLSDIEKLPTISIKAFLRENSLKYKDSASRAELIREAKELWSDDGAYFPIADIMVPKLENIPTEAAVRALSVEQMQMLLEANGHDGACDTRDKNILLEYVLRLWQEQLEPSDPSPDACPALSDLRLSDIANLDDETMAAIAANYRLSLSVGEKPDQIKEKVCNLWVKKQAAVIGSARPSDTQPQSPGLA